MGKIVLGGLGCNISSEKVELSENRAKMDKQFLLKLYPVFRALRFYHRHEVVGLDRIPQDGAALIASSHSLATYDIGLLGAAIYEKHRRISCALIDNAFFKFPGLGEVMEKAGAVRGTRENARDLLASGHLVMVAPGGMQESLRPSTQRYQINWDHRRGFAKMAMDLQIPVILAACPKADDIFEVYDNPLTKWVYQNFRLPFFIARGAGFTPVPRPIKLIHFLSEPMVPPKPSGNPAGEKRQLTAFHRRLVTRMELLIAQAIAYRPDRQSLDSDNELARGSKPR